MTPSAGQAAVTVPWWERRPALFLRETRLARAARFRVTIERSSTDGGAPPTVIMRGRVRVRTAAGTGSIASVVDVAMSDTGVSVSQGGDLADALHGPPRDVWRGFDVEMRYPHEFPFAPIALRALDPDIRRRRHQGSDGSLCYLQEELEPWAVGYGFERAFEGARDWFTAEVAGHFENEVPAPELLAYVPRLSPHVREVLIPAHAVWADPTSFPAPTHGTFDWEWDRYGEHPSVALVGALRGPDRRRSGAWALGELLVPEVEVRETNTRLWRALRLAENAVKANTYRAVRGLWFRLDHEPPPIRGFADLEAALSDVAGLPAGALRELVEPLLEKHARMLGWLPIGLNYPPETRPSGPEHGQHDRNRPTTADTVGGAPEESDRPAREWLMLTLEWSKVAKAVRESKRLAPTGFWPGVRLDGVLSYAVRPRDFARRVGAEYPAVDLERARVVIVGVGALGSTIARSLAAMGVRQFVLVDPDVVSPGNIVRHEARLPDTGRYKVDAMAQILRETNPYVEVKEVRGTRGAPGRALEAILCSPASRPDLVIVAVAQKAVDGQIDAMARRASEPPPVLHAWVMAQAQLLRAFVTRAGTTACLYCNGLYEREQRAGTLDWRYVPGPEQEAEPFFETSCATPAFPGAGNANALAAHVVVELALDVLHGRLDNDASHWVFAGHRIRAVDPTCALAPLTCVRSGFSTHPDCPVCAGEEHDGSQLDPEDTEAYSRELAAAGSPLLMTVPTDARATAPASGEQELSDAPATQATDA